jgi:hypothetical protein
LPVPESPRISTGASVPMYLSSSVNTSRIARLSPTIVE